LRSDVPGKFEVPMESICKYRKWSVRGAGVTFTHGAKDLELALGFKGTPSN
jgi:hypothetical protein